MQNVTPNESPLPKLPEPPSKASEGPINTNLSPAQMEDHKRELLAKVRVLRERAGRAGELAHKDPSKTYMWVNIKEDRQTFFQAWGWIKVTDPKILSPFKQSDNSHRRADVVLYEIDRELYEAIESDKQLRGLEGIEGHKQSAIASFHRNGVKEYIPDVR